MTRCTHGRRRVQFWRRAANFFSRSPLQQPSLFFPNPDPATFDSPPVASFCSIPRSSGLSSTHSDANPVVSLAVQGLPAELSRRRRICSPRRPLAA